jgi:hypothetical protein
LKVQKLIFQEALIFKKQKLCPKEIDEENVRIIGSPIKKTIVYELGQDSLNY